MMVDPNDIDWPRLLVIAGVMISLGGTTSTLVRFVQKLKTWPTRLWLARVLLRICYMGLLYFALDTMVQHWGDPVQLRVYVLFLVLLVYPWATTELTHDVLRTNRAPSARNGERKPGVR